MDLLLPFFWVLGKADLMARGQSPISSHPVPLLNVLDRSRCGGGGLALTAAVPLVLRMTDGY